LQATEFRGGTDSGSLDAGEGVPMKRYEYKIIDTGKHVEAQLNELGSQGWQVVGVTTKKQLLIAPPQAIILMREVEARTAAAA
jgi:hypothetical protein